MKGSAIDPAPAGAGFPAGETPDSLDERAGPIILFDGVCNLCGASMRFVADRDRDRRFRYAFLQSDSGRALVRRHGLSDVDLLSSVVLVDRGQAFRKSTAALEIARLLNRPWPLFYAFIVLPRRFRDTVYDVIGSRRYRWFGRSDVCQLPREDLRDRLLP